MQIIVNGVKHEYPHEVIGYNEVADLIGLKSRELTVTYFWRGDGDLERKGTLTYRGGFHPTNDGNKRQTIKVANGMIFTAVHTGSA